MSNAFAQRLGCFIATIAIGLGLCAHSSIAQQEKNWRPPKHNNSLNMVTDPDSEAIPEPIETPAPKPRTNLQPVTAGSGPIARLIVNPNTSNGSPPYALADQTGRVQRYVEPVPGVDLESHLGQVVVVRADTGPTLLASQLELPSQSLLPMIMSPPTSRAANGRTRDYGVQQAQYVDNDDSSVQLLPDDVALPGDPAMMTGMPGQIPLLGEGYPGAPGMPMGMYGPGCGTPCGPVCGAPCGPECCDPVQCGAGPMMMPYPAPMMSPYPQGGYPASACAPNVAASNGPQCSADVEFTFYRVNMTDQVVGKLSEKYEFSPRFILTFEDVFHLDGRLRYWMYERDTALIGGGDVRPEFHVFDMEAIHRFQGRSTQLTLAGGVRFANAQLTDPTGDTVATDMVGLTLAGDGLTPVLCHPSGYCGWVYGGRVSLLTGDWGGNANSDFLNQNFDDDNMLVTELYAGIEVAKKLQSITLRGRVVWEMQNWHSDVLAQNAGVESIGLFGPGLQIGADF
jgi:hypothetical protein